MGVRETCQHTGDRRLVCQQLSIKGVGQRIRNPLLEGFDCFDLGEYREE